MEDDPWGASADPWGADNGTTSRPEVSLPVPLPIDNEDPIIATTLVLPRNDSLSESDPWASPNTAKVEASTTPTPIVTIGTLPDEGVQPSLPSDGWAVSQDTDDNGWLETTPSIPPESNLSAANPAPETLVAEQVPLPFDEEDDKEDIRISLPLNRVTSEDGWTVPQNPDVVPSAIPVGSPPLAEPPSRFPEENETFNPFNHEDQILAAGLKDTSTGFSAGNMDDDDGFGGFSAGELRGSPGLGFANEDDAYGGWGNDNAAANFGDIQDAWDTNSAGDAAEDRNHIPSENPNFGNEDPDIDDEDGFHSIPAKPKTVVTSEQLQEETWEQARRRIEIQEARAPVELINKLVDQWKDVLDQVFIASGSQDTGKEVEDGLDHETIIRKDRLMNKLTELPDGLSIFVPAVQNTVTWARYQDYLTTIKLDPSASILAKASAESAYRAARRKSQEDHGAWQGRSRLGEANGPDQSQHSAAGTTQQLDASRSRWSLWGRKPSTPVVPLTTSGGGLLEVKAMSPNHTGTHVRDNNSVNGHSSSVSVSVSVSNRDIAPPVRTSGTPTPLDLEASDTNPAPSAVGRFLGRFRRPATATASVDINNRDLELTQDDFSFLADVPAMAPKADTGGDLLSLDNDSRPSDQMTSLEAMLNSKAMPLPSRLTPPSRMSVARGNSGGQKGMSASTNKANSVIDLFGDLDLTGNVDSNQLLKPNLNVGSNLGFDAFTTTSTSPAFQPNVASRSKSIQKIQGQVKSPSFGDSAPLDDDGFGDFGTPAAAAQTNNTLDFDDFGDFAQFQDQQTPGQQHAFSGLSAKPSAHHKSAYAVPSLLNQSTGKVQSKSSPLRLDHSSTARLVSNAAQSPTQWPAPKSPSIPALPPPTSAPARQNAVPSDSASSSRAGTPLNFDFLAAGPSMLAPPRANAASPANSLLGAVDAGKRSPAAPSLSKGQGLSASDLSFFDSL